MKKHCPDNNMKKVLENLESHPSLLKRCQEFYLQRVVNKKSYEEIGKEYGVGVATAHGYVKAYEKVAERYSDNPTIGSVLAFCHAEISRLLKKREEASDSRADKNYTSEIRMFQSLICELSGLISRQTKVDVKIFNNIVGVITSAIPDVLKSFWGKVIDDQVTQEFLERLSSRLEMAVEQEGIVNG